MTIAQALARRPADFTGVVTCTPDSSLASVFSLIRIRRVHRIVVIEGGAGKAGETDQERAEREARKGRLLGIISLSDVLKHVIVSHIAAFRRSCVTDDGLLFTGPKRRNWRGWCRCSPYRDPFGCGSRSKQHTNDGSTGDAGRTCGMNERVCVLLYYEIHLDRRLLSKCLSPFLVVAYIPRRRARARPSQPNASHQSINPNHCPSRHLISPHLPASFRHLAMETDSSSRIQPSNSIEYKGRIIKARIDPDLVRRQRSSESFYS